MNRSSISLATIAALALAGSTPARAQDAPLGGGLGNARGDIGVKVSDTSTLHVGVTAEGGYDTNVFYNDQVRTQSAIVRVIPTIQLTNAGREDDAQRSEFLYDVGASLLYREYINNDPNVRAQRAFNPSVHGSLATGLNSAFKLSLGDQFVRNEDPPYATSRASATGTTTLTSGPIIRDNNLGVVNMGISPGGGRLTFTLRYSNALDWYETSDYSRSSNMTHEGMLDGSWKWLPKTAIYLQGAVGYIHYLHSDALTVAGRHDSIPIRAQTGLRGLLTPKTTVGLGVGYATAIYKGDDNRKNCDVAATSCNPHGVSNILFSFDLGYTPTLLSRIGLSLQHGFRNSPVIGDYYDVDAANLAVSQALGKLVLGAFGRYEYRRYRGYTITPASPTAGAPANTPVVIARRDNVLGAGAQIDYFLQKWFYAGVAYGVILDRATQTPDVPLDLASASYTKQQVFARIGVSY